MSRSLEQTSSETEADAAAQAFSGLRAQCAHRTVLSDAVRRAVGNGIGVATGALCALYLLNHAQPKTALGRLFDRDNPATLIPVLITGVFIWGLVVCLLRVQYLWAVTGLTSKTHLDVLLRCVGTHGAEVTERALTAESLSFGKSPLVRRATVALREWTRSWSLQSVDVVLQQEAAYDDDVVQGGYGLVRLFVWALPVLGLIGTVIGISLAVGGFSDFLGGNIEDVNVIKQNLVSVTGGLSFSFLITLGGLATSLLLMFMAAALQGREERLFSDLQHRITQEFVPALLRMCPPAPPRAAAPLDVLGVESGGAAPSRTALLEAWNVAFRESGDRLVAAVTQGSERLVAAELSKLDALGTVVASMHDRLGKLGEAMQQAVEAQPTIRSAMDELVVGTTGLVESHRQLEAAAERFRKMDAGSTLVEIRDLLAEASGVPQPMGWKLVAGAIGAAVIASSIFALVLVRVTLPGKEPAGVQAVPARLVTGSSLPLASPVASQTPTAAAGVPVPTAAPAAAPAAPQAEVVPVAASDRAEGSAGPKESGAVAMPAGSAKLRRRLVPDAASAAPEAPLAGKAASVGEDPFAELAPSPRPEPRKQEKPAAAVLGRGTVDPFAEPAPSPRPDARKQGGVVTDF